MTEPAQRYSCSESSGSSHPPVDPAVRRLRAQIAANESWARTGNRAARTDPARQGLLERFEREVPEHITDPAERARCAENARKAFYQRLALKSVRARRKAREALAEAEAAEAELAQADDGAE